jgi:hypothetical protein
LNTIWQIFLVALLSAFKFQLAFPLAKSSGLTFWETTIATISGGIAGVFFFVFLSEKLVFFLISISAKKNFSNVVQTKKKPKKKFSKISRFLVKFSRKFGLIGLAFITPSILSIPLGTFISSRLNDKFVRNKPLLIIYLIVSVVFWSFAFSGLIEIF